MLVKKIIPVEIGDHLQIHSKKPLEVYYGEECVTCKSKIDKYELCACGIRSVDMYTSMRTKLESSGEFHCILLHCINAFMPEMRMIFPCS